MDYSIITHFINMKWTRQMHKMWFMWEKCDMNVAAYKTPNSAECIRCGKCIEVCPKKAISTTFSKSQKPNCNSNCKLNCSGCK